MSVTPQERRARQADAFGPVTLIYANAPMWRPAQRLAMLKTERCETNADAVALAGRLFDAGICFNPFVTDDDDNTIFIEQELRERCGQ
jgi:hypothetical protein